MSKKCPCYKCESRHPACHDECSSYIQWKEAQLEIRDAERQLRELETLTIDLARNRKAHYTRRRNM